ncbi:MAG: hypothetical protein IKF17_01605 [Clostridia bacterium]|nr:hypothetical protein [Clostridia bacterium]
MKTFSKILVLFLIITFSIMMSYSFAVDLNLTDPIDGSAANTSTNTNTNSSSNNTNSNSSSSTNNTTSNNATNTTNTSNNSSNTIDEDETTYSGTGNNYNTVSENDTYPNSDETSTTVGLASGNEGLSISDIINIFVIVVGVILIFLGIAILVKSKKE